MAGDDLNQPLGQRSPAPESPRRRVVAFSVACAAITVAGFAIGTLVFASDPHGGEPFAIASLPAARQASMPDAASGRGSITKDQSDTTGSLKQSASLSDGDTVTSDGVTVHRPVRGDSPRSGPLVIDVQKALGEAAMTDNRARSDRPDRASRDKTVASGAPRIALFVGGMGLSPAATTEAIDTMPAEVSLAFAANGTDLDKSATRARAKGHELLLQIPMETAGDAPASLGSHVLRLGASPQQRSEDLKWAMTRMTGYVGITNFLGGAFTADGPAMTALLKDIAGRGLLYIDDGTSKRSVAPTLALSLGVPSARADVVLDATSDPAMVRAAFVRLEAIARTKGSAIGMASGLPDHMGAIAQFARSLPSKGIALVPVSTLAGNAPSIVAEAP